MLKHWIVLRVTQIIIDFLLVWGGFQLAYFWQTDWQNHSTFPYSQFLIYSFLGSALWITFILFAKYYRVPPRSGIRSLFDLFLTLMGGALASGVLIVLYFFTREELFSRMISLNGFLLGVLGLGLSYGGFRLLFKHIKKKPEYTYKTLVIGANRVSEKLIRKINQDEFAPYQVHGVIDPYGLMKGKNLFYTTGESVPILGKLDKLEPICQEELITAIIQCDAYEHTINIISLCEDMNIKYQFDPALRGVFEENLRIREVAGVPLISFVQRDFDTDQKKAAYKGVDWMMRQFLDVG